MKRWMMITMAGLALSPAGCAPAREAGPVIEVQREAAETLAQRSVRDAIALRGATEALLEVRRATLVARLETAALEASFAGEPWRVEGWPNEQAAGWLDRFDAVATEGAARRALVDELPPVARFDEAAADLLTALDRRHAQTAALFADLLASTAAVEAAVAGRAGAPSPIELLREIYEQELRTRIDEPQRRDAVDRILDRLLPTSAEGGAR